MGLSNFFQKHIVRNCRGGHWPSGRICCGFSGTIGEFVILYCRTSNARPYILNLSDGRPAESDQVSGFSFLFDIFAEHWYHFEKTKRRNTNGIPH